MSFADAPLRDVLASIAAKTPAPGGGAVASTTGALAASLARMVVAYSLGKKNLAEHQPVLERADGVLARMSDVFIELADEDAAAYALVNELSRLPEADPRREREWRSAVDAALAAPSAVVATSCDLLRLLEQLASITNRHLRSDLAIAAVLADSAAVSGYWNVRVNLPSLNDAAQAERINQTMRQMLDEASRRRTAIESACA